MRKTKIKDIYILNNLFTYQEIKDVRLALDKSDWSDDELSPNSYTTIESASENRILVEKNLILKNNIEQDFLCQVGEEGIGTVVRYEVGWTLEYHADCWSDLPTYTGYPSRDISSIIYLTDDFEGGNLVFPDLDIEIEPAAGSAIYFPSDEKHMHVVTEVKSGNRSTCTGFWHILSKENK